MKFLTLTVYDGSSETDVNIPLHDVRFSNVVEPRTERLWYKAYYGTIFKEGTSPTYRYLLSISISPVWGISTLQSDLQSVLDAALDPAKQLRFYQNRGNNGSIVVSLDTNAAPPAYVHFVPEDAGNLEYLLEIQRNAPTVRFSARFVSDKLYKTPMKFGEVL